ncbi:MerR family transcriptional regulator [Kitasatospora sp. NPDC096077]|uniref:MerR family transcriptional regulator n=1 Tax=Kitasatospora sp. NPDC096077 TaxID=3155544 RepID=UPI0033250432
MTALLILTFAVTAPQRPAAHRRTAAPPPGRSVPGRPGPGGGELLASTNGTVRLHPGGRPTGGTHTVVLRFRDAQHARAGYESTRYRDLLEERFATAVPFSAVIVPELPTAGRAPAVGSRATSVGGAGTMARVPVPAPVPDVPPAAGAAAPGPAALRMDIADFTARAGLSARSVRAYHARGLLPPAERVGKRVFYGPEHVRRIASIQYLQRRGLNLEAILTLSELDPPAEPGGRHALPTSQDPFHIVAEVLDRPHGSADELARDLGTRIAESIEALTRGACPPSDVTGAPHRFGPAMTALLMEAFQAVLTADGAHRFHRGPADPDAARTARCRQRPLSQPSTEPQFIAAAGAVTRSPAHPRGSGTPGGPQRLCSPDAAERVGTSV